MTLERIRATCLSFPHATEQIQWGDNLVFKVAGKMFAVASLSDGSHAVGFRCTPEEFAELIEIDGIIPAPYLARAHWVRLSDSSRLRSSELIRRLRSSYDLVFAALPKKLRANLKNEKLKTEN